MKKSQLLAVGTIALLGAAVTARASDDPAFNAFNQAHELQASKNYSLAIDPARLQAALDAEGKSSSTAATDQAAPSDSTVLTLDGVGGMASKIHGFADFKFLTQYLTPRGLAVQNHGLNFQPTVGLVFDLYSSDGFINDVSVIGGAWSNFQSTNDSDIWTECDFFGGFDVKFAKKFDFSYSIEAWTFPDVGTEDESNPTTEYNMEFKTSFDDTEYLKAFGLHPYVNVFWNFAGASQPVVSQALLGQNDHTFYVELGITPSYTYKGLSPDYPITFSLPIYFTMGDSSFWGETPNGDRSNVGVISAGLKIGVPLAFIPKEYGAWNAYVGVTWINTLNPALSYVNENVLSSGNDVNHVVAYGGFGFGF